MFDGCPAFNAEQPLQSPLNPSSTWLHTPPAQMPWGVPIAEQPTVMRFTGDSSFGSMSGFKNVGHEAQNLQKCQSKRKSWDCEIECSPPTKQLITEEKMAENLNCLHISNSYVSHQIGSSQPMSIPLPESSRTSESAPLSSESSSSSSLVDTAIDSKDRTVSLCEQLRKLISESSVIASPIINKIERPSNALVLWQPPGGSILKDVVTALSKEGDKKDGDSEPQPSTPGMSFTPVPSSSQSRWDDLMDNNNSSNAMDLNLCSSSSSSSLLLPSEVPLPDDEFMDLPEESMMDL